MTLQVLLCVSFAASLEISREGLGERWTDVHDCPRVLCSTSLPEGVCVQGNSTSLAVQACPPLHVCADGLCKALPPSLGLPGELCVSNSTCQSQKCEHHECHGHGYLKRCKDSSECNRGLYCANGLCWKQLAPGLLGCYSDYDCENSSGCALARGRMGKCEKYFSVPRYQWVSDCVNYFSRLCESGSCFAAGGSGKGICIDAIQSDPMYQHTACQSHVQCQSKGGEFSFYGLCKCSGNAEGRKYCAPFPGDPPGKRLLSLLRAWYNSAEVHHCHSLLRESPSCISLWANSAALLSAYYAYQYAAEIRQADMCVVQALFPDYIALEDTAGLLFVAAFLVVT